MDRLLHDKHLPLGCLGVVYWWTAVFGQDVSMACAHMSRGFLGHGRALDA